MNFGGKQDADSVVTVMQAGWHVPIMDTNVADSCRDLNDSHSPSGSGVPLSLLLHLPNTEPLLSREPSKAPDKPTDRSDRRPARHHEGTVALEREFRSWNRTTCSRELKGPVTLQLRRDRRGSVSREVSTSKAWKACP